MPQYTDPTHFSGNTVAAILGGIGVVLTALGIPALVKNWKEGRELKYANILANLDETKRELAEVKKDLYATKDELKKVRTIVSVVLPMMKLKNQHDPETLELIRIFERESGINITPSQC